MALTFGLTRLICFKWACITSRAESFLLRIMSKISTALMKQISSDKSRGPFGDPGAESGIVSDPNCPACAGCAGSRSDGLDSARAPDNGAAAAENATVVPSLSASRRVIVPGTRSLRADRILTCEVSSGDDCTESLL